MAKQLSSLDLHFLLKELKELEGSRADKIYNKGKEEIYIQFFKKWLSLLFVPGKRLERSGSYGSLFAEYVKVLFFHAPKDMGFKI